MKFCEGKSLLSQFSEQNTFRIQMFLKLSPKVMRTLLEKALAGLFI